MAVADLGRDPKPRKALISAGRACQFEEEKSGRPAGESPMTTPTVMPTSGGLKTCRHSAKL